MVIMYEARTETPPRELTAFRAVVDPRLMQARMEVTAKETATERSGMFQPIGTTESQDDPGRPPSRAKDQSCLDAVATSDTQQALSMTTMIAVMTLAPA